MCCCSEEGLGSVVVVIGVMSIVFVVFVVMFIVIVIVISMSLLLLSPLFMLSSFRVSFLLFSLPSFLNLFSFSLSGNPQMQKKNIA